MITTSHDSSGLGVASCSATAAERTWTAGLPAVVGGNVILQREADGRLGEPPRLQIIIGIRATGGERIGLGDWLTLKSCVIASADTHPHPHSSSNQFASVGGNLPASPCPPVPALGV